MAIQWTILRDRILRVLGDTNRESARWQDDDLNDYINEALISISAHTAQTKTYVTRTEAAISALALPDDVLGLGPLSVTTRNELVFFTPMDVTPGTRLSLTSDVLATGQDGYYYEWPKGTVRFVRPIPSGSDVTVNYYAYWARVEALSETLSVPRWMEEALKWYCCHLAITKPAAKSSNLRQWNTKRDSGDPTDSPLLDFADYCLKRYRDILNNQPAQSRSGWEAR